MKSSFCIKYHHDNVVAPVKIKISVIQLGKILSRTTIDLRCFLSPLRIEFDFDCLEPLELKFATLCQDMDLHPFYIDRIQFDDLADIPFVAHTGNLLKKGNYLGVGNCLYTDGELVYNFNLPLCSNCKIV